MQALLLLADGRFPAGGHAHSGGVEAAVADGRVVDVATLTAFTEGRLRTVGLVDAAIAMATTWRLGDVRAHGTVPPWETGATMATVRARLANLDAEVDARTPAPPLRAASRRLGRQLLRVASRCWPSPVLDLAMEGPVEPHQSVALGLVGVAAGMAVDEVGHLATHHAVTTPMQAGVRLLGLDPFAAAAATARLADVAATVVAEAGRFATGALALLPARSATHIDIAAKEHAAGDGHLFAT